MNNFDRVSIIQHSIETIDSYSNDIADLHRLIYRMYDKINDLTRSAERECLVIQICLRDEEFKDELCSDFLSKAESYMTKFQRREN